jgi:hypothetical protein
MPALSAEEVVRLVEVGDLYALMLLVNCAWLEKYHPDAAHGAVYVYHQDDTPPHRVTIPASAACPSVR